MQFGGCLQWVFCVCLFTTGNIRYMKKCLLRVQGHCFRAPFSWKGHSSVQAYLEGTHLSLFWGASELIQLNECRSTNSDGVVLAQQP